MMPVDHLTGAARGVTNSFRELRVEALHRGDAGSMRMVEALSTAEIWARLAVESGGEQADDIRALASILLMRAGFERQHGYGEMSAPIDAEALTLLEIAANQGDDQSVDLLVLAGNQLPAGGFELIAKIRDGVA